MKALGFVNHTMSRSFPNGLTLWGSTSSYPNPKKWKGRRHEYSLLQIDI